MPPIVSIITLNWSHPEAKYRHVIRELLDTISITTGVSYELVVVDNSSPDPTTTGLLEHYRDDGIITTLVLSPENHYFCEGNNIGVRFSNPESKYILLLSSDIKVLRPDWLWKLVQWMEPPFTFFTLPYDIISLGWSPDKNVQPSMVRPEGFCCMFRRRVWRDLDPAFVQCNGLEEAIALSIRAGARCGVLANMAKYIHHGPGSESWRVREEITAKTTRQPDYRKWFDGLTIHTLDFTLTQADKDRMTATDDYWLREQHNFKAFEDW